MSSSARLCLAARLLLRIALIAATASACPFAVAETLVGRVIAVPDGNTIEILGSGFDRNGTRRIAPWKVWLSGIDAPERAQPFGPQSQQNLAAMVYEQAVTAKCRRFDRYGRKICTVYLNGRDLGLVQLRAGLAWHFEQQENEQPSGARKRYADAQEDARATGVGLWSDPNPTSPWEWRTFTQRSSAQ